MQLTDTQPLILDVYEQMALDEAILNLVGEDSLILRFYQWKGPAITFGYSQPFELVSQEAARRGWDEFPMARRPTGGGIVFHGKDITFSLIFPWERLSSPDAIYQKIHQGIQGGLKAAGFLSRLWPRGERDESKDALCFTRPEALDLVDQGGKKMLGGALRRRNPMGLYQGSLHLGRLKLPAYSVEWAIAAGIESSWGRPPERALKEAWLEAGGALAAKYRSPEWNQKNGAWGLRGVSLPKFSV